MKKNESIKHIMSADIVSITVKDKVSSARKLMEEKCVHHVPVMSGKKLMGIVSAVDIYKASFSNSFAGADKADDVLDHTVNLEDVMTKNITTIKTSDTIRHAAGLLSTSNFNSLVVVDDSDEVAGIVTSKDLISYLVEQY